MVRAFTRNGSYTTTLVEQDDKVVAKPKSTNFLLNSLLITSAILFFTLIIIDVPNKWFSFFYAFPFLGLFLSVGALKDLFKTKNKLLDKFCNATANTSCNTVVHSSKWKVLKTVGFSDLGIVFFIVQIVGLFLMGLSDGYIVYFSIQTVLLIVSIPVIFGSLYYQKYIEKMVSHLFEHYCSCDNGIGLCVFPKQNVCL